MKKNKVFRAVIVVCMMAGLLAGCGDQKKELDTAALAESLLNDISYQDTLTELSSEDISYYITMEDGVEGIMYMSSGATAEEFAVFTAPDEEVAKGMLTNAQDFLEAQKQSFEDYIPEEAKRIEDAVVVQQGKYTIFSVSGESEQAQKLIDQAFGN